ncbi:MAG: hypothetical protein V4627_16465 [Pseudomonadota bacterium]
MSAWEDIGSAYVEAATQALPLHRVAIFAAGFLISLVIQNQTHLSALESLAVVPLSELITFDKGLLSKATTGNILWALIATLVGITFSKGLLRLAYTLVDRATGASATAASLDKSWLYGLSIEERNAAVELVESGLTEPRSRLRAYTSINELLVGIGFVCIAAAFWGNILDGVVGGLALVGALFSHMVSIHIFLTDYYGAALSKAHLQGKKIPDIAKLQ